VIQPEPEVGDGFVRFTQTVGGRIGWPAPRPVAGRSYFHFGAVSAWTTLELLIRADGATETRLVAASPFPATPSTAQTAGSSTSSGRSSSSSQRVRRGGTRGRRRLPPPRSRSSSADSRPRSSVTARSSHGVVTRGDTLVEQGKPGHDLVVLLDGVFDVEIDGEVVAQVGSGAILGERAVLGEGRRNATLRAVRSSRVAVIGSDEIGRAHPGEISARRSV
jgi:hypothetical protein